MKNRCDRAPFIPSGHPGGVEGVTPDFFKSETICAFYWYATHEAMNSGRGLNRFFLKVRNSMGFSVSP